MKKQRKKISQSRFLSEMNWGLEGKPIDPWLGTQIRHLQYSSCYGGKGTKNDASISALSVQIPASSSPLLSISQKRPDCRKYNPSPHVFLRCPRLKAHNCASPSDEINQVDPKSNLISWDYSLENRLLLAHLVTAKNAKQIRSQKHNAKYRNGTEI